MVEEFKQLKDNVLRSIFSAVAGASDSTGEANGSKVGILRDVIASLATMAGKGKDEIVQMISKEIGQAVAGVIKEPVHQILENRKVRVTIEFVPRDGATGHSLKAKKKRKPARTKV